MDSTHEINRRIRQIGVNAVAEASGLNKSTISRYVRGLREYSLGNFERIRKAVDTLEKDRLRGQTSVREATLRVREGEDWRIAYFDFVDSFRAAQSALLWNEKPVDGLDLRSLALICAIVMQLADESRMSSPEWARLSLELDEPWFVSKFSSLRAVSLVESPVYFKRNNIFVGRDFLERT